MELPEARKKIMEEFLASWNGRTQVALGNERFEPPADADWVRVTALHLGSSQRTLGRAPHRRFERAGRVIVQVFTRRDRGTADADELAQAARAALEGKRFDELVLHAGTVNEQPSEERWHRQDVEIDFDYDERK